MGAHPPEFCAVPPSPTRTVQLTHGETAFAVHGDTGPWVVLVHGLITPMAGWLPLAELLAQAGFRVLRFDSYGRGASTRPDVPHDAELLLGQLSELCDALDIERAHHVGWSMGGLLCAMQALRQPERMERLCLIAPGIFLEQPRALGWVLNQGWLNGALQRIVRRQLRGIAQAHH